MVRRATVWALLCGALIAGLTAQGPSSAVAQFEVASVKPSRPNAIGGGLDATPGRFAAENLPLAELIAFAYETDRFRTAGPGWIEKERFDIAATGAVTGQVRPMLRQLLQDRFALRAHFETRPVPVYVLSIDRADGTLGPHLRRVEMDCSVRQSMSDGMMPCSTRNQPRGTLVARGTNWATAVLHREMAAAMGRLVLDRTGLKGQFDMRLEWADPVAQISDTQPADRPSFITALREQLGLRLEPSVERVQVLVIEGVERPSPD